MNLKARGLLQSLQKFMVLQDAFSAVDVAKQFYTIIWSEIISTDFMIRL